MKKRDRVDALNSVSAHLLLSRNDFSCLRVRYCNTYVDGRRNHCRNLRGWQYSVRSLRRKNAKVETRDQGRTRADVGRDHF